MTARPIRRNAQTPDRNGKIFYTSTTSLSHISKHAGHFLTVSLMTLLTAKITKPRRSAATGSATKKTASQKHNAAHAAENRACSASALQRVRKTENRPLSCESGRFSGAGGGARTRTVLPPRDFKSLASACFATPARSVTSYHRSQHLSSTGNPDGRRAHIARSVRQICAAAADTRHTPLASGQKI